MSERVWSLTIAALSWVCCLGLACEREAPRSLECPTPEQVTRVDGVQYEGFDCDAAIARAESRLTTAYYRKACEQLAPSAGLPPTALDAFVSRCRPADPIEGGAVLDLEICCPAPPPGPPTEAPAGPGPAG